MDQPSEPRTRRHTKSATNLLGPGLVTGAADDDPSGIATYSQAGAQFGYALLWTVFLTTPFMIAIQLVSAFIGRATPNAGRAPGAMPPAPVFRPNALILTSIPCGLEPDRYLFRRFLD